MYSLKRLTFLATGGLWLWTSALCAQGQPASTEERRKTLNDLLEQQWEYSLRVSPIKASFLGDKRWNDQLDDFSQAAIDRDLQETQKFLTRFEAIKRRQHRTFHCRQPRGSQPFLLRGKDVGGEFKKRLRKCRFLHWRRRGCFALFERLLQQELRRH